MKSFAYFCAGISALCLGAAALIFAMKYEPPKPSALDEMQDTITRQFTEAFEENLKDGPAEKE